MSTTPSLASLPTSLELTGSVEFQAAAAPKEGEAPGRPKFTIAAYTGAPMRVDGFFSPVILALDGMTATRQRIPILREHDTSRIIGMSEKVHIDASGVHIDGVVTGDSAEATEVVSQAKNGFDWQASVGVNFVRREFLKEGKKATVNGREITGPMIIGIESLLKETSFVALGADNNTTASVAAKKSESSRPLTLAELHNRRQS